MTTRAGIVVAAVLALFGVVWWTVRAPAPPEVVPVTGCEGCHTEPVPDHFGTPCVACHLGDPTADTVPLAHAGLEAEPGALQTAGRTCGMCHPVEHARVADSLMATGRGLVAVDRWAFGEIDGPDGHQTLSDVLATAEPTPAEDHLRRLCAGCHLHTRAENRDDAVRGTGSGCGACHVPVEGEGHPDVAAVPSDAMCLGCHSRSGRISLGYAGLAEIGGHADCARPTALYDGRQGCRLEPDVHHEAGLSCVDCHLHTELMGDGETHLHKEDALELRCGTCHDPAAATTTWAEVDDPITRAVLRLRGEERPDDELVRLGARGTPVWNLRPEGEGWVLRPKAGGAPRSVTQVSAAHAPAGHERLDCAACHSAWAPMCTSCHTSFEPTGEQWDFGAADLGPGAWVERSEAMEAGPFALGVTAEGRIVPATPGMIATLELPTGVERETRLFAPASPHTTGGRALGCVNCHREPVVLGLGAGSLTIAASGPRFTPADPVPDHPSLARDGWTALDHVAPGRGTRTGFRSLDPVERNRVLRVGVCLDCHDGDSGLYEDFDSALDRFRDGTCRFRPGPWIR